MISNAVAECDNDGQCRFVECEAGFVDCDGEEANGCEEDFRGTDENTMIAAAELIEKEELPATAGGDIWAFHTPYRIATPCTNCDPADSALPPGGPSEPLSTPDPSDLLAVFQAGWSTAGLHFRIKVFDDDPFSTADVDPRHQDNLELVYFGLPPDQVESPGADNHQLYVSFTGRTASATSKAYDDLIVLETRATPNGCRISDLRLTPNFLSGLDGPAQGLTPKLGHRYTFNLGINDFDRPVGAPSDAGVAREWQHHLFHKDPQNEYWFKSTNVGELILEGPATEAN